MFQIYVSSGSYVWDFMLLSETRAVRNTATEPGTTQRFQQIRLSISGCRRIDGGHLQSTGRRRRRHPV